MELIRSCKTILFKTESFALDMRYLLLLLLALILQSQTLFAQVLKPTEWVFSIEPQTTSVGQEVEFVAKAKIQEGWYLYSNDFDPNLGPNLTVFKFKSNPAFEIVGKTLAINPKKKFDDVWEGEIKYFLKAAEFRQKIKIKGPIQKIEGSYDGQACTEADGRCVSVEGDFSVAINVKLSDTKTGNVAESKAPESKATLPETNSLSVNEGLENTEAKTLDTNSSIESSALTEVVQTPTETVDQQPDYNLVKESNLWGFFLLAFLSGLVALLTPCVFPLIPMTVSFFTKRAGSRAESIKKSLFFGFSIIAIYTLIGTVVSRINGPEFANFLSTHWLPNLVFFIVFVVFGISFLGAFEILLPSWIANKTDREADKGGYYGIFFMAFTIALVSFSCTGPIVGVILVESAGGLILKPIVGMLGFSLAFALPFSLLSIFPNAMQSLPKSGGWLNSVKVVLGFLELALSLKFLSIADQAYHWNLLDRDIYLVLWIVIFGLLGLYLLGKLRLPHDSAIEKLSVGRLLLAIAVLSFTVYLIPGLWGAPLKALSGYLPPMHTQDFNVSASEGVSSGSTSQNVSSLCEPPKYADLLHWPHNLNGYFDYQQALKCSKEQGKPIFIDFTGHGCVNCREMEARVWSDPRVLKKLREEFVLLALYVDDKTELPQKDWYISKYDGKEKMTIGKQNADFQVTNFNNNAQPYYVIQNSEGRTLLTPRAYDLDIQAFLDYLDSGIEAYKESTK